MKFLFSNKDIKNLIIRNWKVLNSYKKLMIITYVATAIDNGGAIFLWPLAFVFPNMLRACNDDH